MTVCGSGHMLGMRDDMEGRWYRLHSSSRSAGVGMEPCYGAGTGVLLLWGGRVEAGRWARMNLVVAEAMAEIRSRQLTVEQQGRLAMAWMDIYVVGCGAGCDEVEWRKALGYGEAEWGEVRSAYRDVLERDGGVWGLRFLHAEVVRQGEVSEKQRGNVGRRYGGVPKPTVVESGIPTPTTVYQMPTVVYPATATAIEAKNPRVIPVGFLEFWEGYRCERRRNKPAAMKEWGRQGCEAIWGEVVAGLERYKAGRQWKDGYMPEPARWLKARGWEDEVVEEPKGEEW